jgi:hypothetical protein
MAILERLVHRRRTGGRLPKLRQRDSGELTAVRSIAPSIGAFYQD